MTEESSQTAGPESAVGELRGAIARAVLRKHTGQQVLPNTLPPPPPEESLESYFKRLEAAKANPTSQASEKRQKTSPWWRRFFDQLGLGS